MYDDLPPIQREIDHAQTVRLLETITDHLSDIRASLTAIFWLLFGVSGFWFYQVFFR